jgi:hypothetical protein
MRRPTLGLPTLAVVALTAACAGDGGRAPAGSERGACYGNGTCDDGLQCLSDLCVRPPGADCAKIAARLGGLVLGNYAPVEVRDQYLEETRRACERARPTPEQAACVLAATSRNALARCGTAFGVGDCAVIVAHLDRLRPTAPDPFLVTAADRLATRCRNEVPTPALQACVLAATSVAEVERCRW